MIKRIIILVVLTSILLVLVKFQSSTPVNNSVKSEGSSKYSKVVYTISNIKGDRYYGKRENGNEIIFSAKNITSDEKIQIHDEVICYFDKDNLGKGLVKVEKK
ncbi:hypothetical protein [Neobacillus cucumis]|uniref:DUF3221 domain-containing protein n=1 Tax=Neobacillus cucumis TaxID=1740721 RepID=A0A2N5HSJ9_9BACI|nr:hypothetical protein [Neobacillus cucumis]PLS08483.1 hypothetical protein CVD27_03525 [Neobacillus cucumis]